MKKLTRILAIILSLALVFGLAACGNQSEEPNNEGKNPPAASDLKVGFIFLHDENSTYDANFIQAAKAASEDKRENIPVGELKVGLKCGGSDGFSGITANPLLGRFSDWIVSQGGTTVLTEVPEICKGGKYM